MVVSSSTPRPCVQAACLIDMMINRSMFILTVQDDCRCASKCSRNGRA